MRSTVMRIVPGALIVMTGASVLPACGSRPGQPADDAAPAASAAMPAGWTIEETMKVRRVDHVRLSPDGRRVLFAVRTALLTGGKGEYRTRIHTARIDGTDERPLTPDEHSATGAEWSPDGRWIAFLADRSGTAAGNTIWMMPADGGEARAIDAGDTGAANLRWSPDGTRLAFTMPAPATAAQKAAAENPDAPRVVDAEIRPTQLWVIDVGNGQGAGPARALTPATVNVHADRDFGAPFDWTPDGSAIAFGYNRDGDWWNHWPATGVSIVNVAGDVPRPLASAGAMVPAVSPDGRSVAWFVAEGAHPADGLQVQVASRTGGTPRTLPETFHWHPTLVGWSANGRQVYVAEARGTVTRLFALPADGGPAATIDPGDAVMEGFSLDASRGLVAFARQTLTEPMEVHVAPPDDFRAARVSRANAALPAHPLPRTELVRWRSKDEAEIEGLLTYPMGHEPGRRYPLVVAVRSGGVSFQQTFVANAFQGGWEDYYPVTELAMRGYAVLQCNSRGGALPGYGPGYARPWARPRDKAFHDVMTGVDYVIGLGLADPARLGITGMSNGGLVTSWVITETDRFKAAIVASGITELVSDATTNPWISADLGAEPWENIQPFLQHSPLLHLGRVTTPTLVLRGGDDEPVPWNQAYGLYRALQRRGVPTELVVYPGEGHPVVAPKHLVDTGRRHVEWMGRWVR